jgi:hypothetical protein
LNFERLVTRVTGGEDSERDLEQFQKYFGDEGSRGLGRLVRESWSEGPTAPSTEYLLSVIRPALAEIDRERRAEPWWTRALDRLSARIGSVLRPSPALAVAAVGAFLFVVMLVPRSHTARGLLETNLPLTRHPLPTQTLVMPRSGSAYEGASFPLDGLGSVYEISPARRPAVLFHSPDGSVTLWVIDDGDLSSRAVAHGPWG